MTDIIKTKYTLRRDLRTYCCKCGCEIKANNELAYIEKFEGDLVYKGAVVREEIDDEGMYWRTLCKPCAESLSDVNAETVFNSYPEGNYEGNDDYAGGALPYYVDSET